MANLNLTPEMISKMLETASRKMGTTPAELERRIKAGEFNSFLGNMKSNKNDSLDQIMTSPEFKANLAKNKVAQQFLKSLLNGR